MKWSRITGNPNTAPNWQAKIEATEDVEERQSDRTLVHEVAFTSLVSIEGWVNTDGISGSETVVTAPVTGEVFNSYFQWETTKTVDFETLLTTKTWEMQFEDGSNGATAVSRSLDPVLVQPVTWFYSPGNLSIVSGSLEVVETRQGVQTVYSGTAVDSGGMVDEVDEGNDGSIERTFEARRLEDIPYSRLF